MEGRWCGQGDAVKEKEGDTSMGLDIPTLGKYAVSEYGEVSGELGVGGGFAVTIGLVEAVP